MVVAAAGVGFEAGLHPPLGEGWAHSVAVAEVQETRWQHSLAAAVVAVAAVPSAAAAVEGAVVEGTSAVALAAPVV